MTWGSTKRSWRSFMSCVCALMAGHAYGKPRPFWSSVNRRQALLANGWVAVLPINLAAENRSGPYGAGQDQITRGQEWTTIDITKLQAIEQDILDKVSAPASRPAPVAAPAHKPAPLASPSQAAR